MTYNWNFFKKVKVSGCRPGRSSKTQMQSNIDCRLAKVLWQQQSDSKGFRQNSIRPMLVPKKNSEHLLEENQKSMGCIPINPALGKLRQKDHHAFLFSQVYRVRPFFKNGEKNKKQNILHWSRKMCSENRAEQEFGEIKQMWRQVRNMVSEEDEKAKGDKISQSGTA